MVFVIKSSALLIICDVIISMIILVMSLVVIDYKTLS